MSQVSDALAALLPDLEQKFLRYCVADATGAKLLNLAGFKYLLKSCPGLDVHDDRIPVFFAAGAGIGEGETIPRTLRLTLDSFLGSLKRIAVEKYGNNDRDQSFLKLILECMLPHRLEDPTFAAFLRGSMTSPLQVGAGARTGPGATMAGSSASPALRSPPSLQQVGGTPQRPPSAGSSQRSSASAVPPAVGGLGFGSGSGSGAADSGSGTGQGQGSGPAQSSTAAAAAGMVVAQMEQMARAGIPYPSSSSSGSGSAGVGVGVGEAVQKPVSRTAAGGSPPRAPPQPQQGQHVQMQASIAQQRSPSAGGGGARPQPTGTAGTRQGLPMPAGASIGNYARAAALASASGSPLSQAEAARGRAVLVGSVSPSGLLSLPISSPPDPRTAAVTVQLLQHPVNYAPTGGATASSPGSPSSGIGLGGVGEGLGGGGFGGLDWSQLTLPSFMTSLRLQRFLQGMQEFGIERVEDLLDLSDQDLSSLGMKPLHRRKLREALLLYVQAVTALPATTTSVSSSLFSPASAAGAGAGLRSPGHLALPLGTGAVAPWYSPSNAPRMGGTGVMTSPQHSHPQQQQQGQMGQGQMGQGQMGPSNVPPITARSSGGYSDSRHSGDSGSPPVGPPSLPTPGTGGGSGSIAGSIATPLPSAERPQRSFAPPPMDPPRPTSLPHWEEYANAEGYLYYHCPVTGVTQWTKPKPSEGTVRTISERKAAQAAKTAAVQEKVASALQSVLGLQPAGRGGAAVDPSTAGDGLTEITGVTGYGGGGGGGGEGKRTRRPSTVSTATGGRRPSIVGGGGTAEERLSAAQGLPPGPTTVSSYGGGQGQGQGGVPLLRTYSAASINTTNAGEGIQPGSLELLKALLDHVAAAKGIGGQAQAQFQAQAQAQAQAQRRADSPSGRSMGGHSAASSSFAGQFLGVSGLLPSDPGPLAISQVMKSNSTVGRASVLARHARASSMPPGGGGGGGRRRSGGAAQMPGSPTPAALSSPSDGSGGDYPGTGGTGGTGSATGSATEAFTINTGRQGGGLSVAAGEGGMLALERQWSSGASVGGSIGGGMGGMGGTGVGNGYMKGAMTPSLFVRQHQAQKEAIARNVAAEVRTLAAAESAVDIYPEIYADMPQMDEATFDHYVRSHALANPRKMGYADPRPDIRPAVRLGTVNPDLAVGRVEFSNTGRGLGACKATAVFAGQLRQNLYTARADPNTPRTAGEIVDKTWGGAAVAPSATASGYAYRHAAALSAWTGQGSVYDRLTDHRGFTGMHRHRFDPEGRGKGMAGRDGTYDVTAMRATIPEPGQGAPYLVDNRLASYAPSLREGGTTRPVSGGGS